MKLLTNFFIAAVICLLTFLKEKEGVNAHYIRRRDHRLDDPNPIHDDHRYDHIERHRSLRPKSSSSSKSSKSTKSSSSSKSSKGSKSSKSSSSSSSKSNGRPNNDVNSGSGNNNDNPTISSGGTSRPAQSAGTKEPVPTSTKPAQFKAETAIRSLVSTMPNSRSLTTAIDTGLIPQSLFTDIDSGFSSCKDDDGGAVTIPGTVDITSELRVPENSNLLKVSGTFTPTDYVTTALDNIQVTLYGVDGPQPSSAQVIHGTPGSPLNLTGKFEIILTDPLPGIIPYFLVFSPIDCNKELRRRRRLSLQDGGSQDHCGRHCSRHLVTNDEIENADKQGLSMMFVQNANTVTSKQLTVTLSWNGPVADLDLHIVEPGQNQSLAKVFYLMKCGMNCTSTAKTDICTPSDADKAYCSYLDLDDIDGRGPEHYYNPLPDPDGVYKLYVNLFDRNREVVFNSATNTTSVPPKIPWTLSAKLGTKVIWTQGGEFNASNFTNTDNFDYDQMMGPYYLNMAQISESGLLLTQDDIDVHTMQFLLLHEWVDNVTTAEPYNHTSAAEKERTIIEINPWEIPSKLYPNLNAKPGDSIQFSWPQGRNASVWIYPSHKCNLTSGRIFVGDNSTMTEYILKDSDVGKVLTFVSDGLNGTHCTDGMIFNITAIAKPASSVGYPYEVVSNDTYPLGAADWFPITWTNETVINTTLNTTALFDFYKASERDYVNFLYAWQFGRDQESNVSSNGTAESFLNKDFGDETATSATGMDLGLYKMLDTLVTNVDFHQYFFDSGDFEKVEKVCEYANHSLLESAICAGRSVKILYEEYQGRNLMDDPTLNMNVDERKVATRIYRHHTVAHAAALNKIGFANYFSKVTNATWRFFFDAELPNELLSRQNSTKCEGCGHVWIGVRIFNDVYFMDSANDRYIKYGIGPENFELVGDSKLSEVAEEDVNDNLTFSLTPDSTDLQLGALWSNVDNQVYPSTDWFVTFDAYFGNSTEQGSGIVFVLQSDDEGSDAIGTTGGQFLAYGNQSGDIYSFGITPSLGIEFDTNSDTTDTSDIQNKDHISIWKNGDMYNPIGDPVYALEKGSPLDSDGHWYHIEISYIKENVSSTNVKTGGTIQIYLDPVEDAVKALGTLSGFTPTLRLSRKIGSLDFLGDNVMWGFTSATGYKLASSPANGVVKDADRHRVHLVKGIQYGRPDVDASDEYSTYEFQKW